MKSVISTRIVWHRHSCLCRSLLLKEASTGRRASTPPREKRARWGPRCRCHTSAVIHRVNLVPASAVAQNDEPDKWSSHSASFAQQKLKKATSSEPPARE